MDSRNVEHYLKLYLLKYLPHFTLIGRKLKKNFKRALLITIHMAVENLNKSKETKPTTKAIQII